MRTYRVTDVALLGAIDEMAETDVTPAVLGSDRWCYARAEDGERFLMDPQGRVQASDRSRDVVNTCRGIVDSKRLTLYANDETVIDCLFVEKSLEIPTVDIAKIIDGMTQPPVRPVRRSAA